MIKNEAKLEKNHHCVYIQQKHRLHDRGQDTNSLELRVKMKVSERQREGGRRRKRWI